MKDDAGGVSSSSSSSSSSTNNSSSGLGSSGSSVSSGSNGSGSSSNSGGGRSGSSSASSGAASSGGGGGGEQRGRYGFNFPPLGSKPTLPSSLPPGVSVSERSKSLAGDPRASLSALHANPYGWRDEARAARTAPLWMLYEQDKGVLQPAKKDRDTSRFSGRRSMGLIKYRQRDAAGRVYAVGGRKTSSARVWVSEGDGLFTVNRKPLQLYFGRLAHRLQAMGPLTATQAVGAFNVDVSVRGGGLSGQAGAIRHGLAKALSAFDPNLKPVVKTRAFLGGLALLPACRAGFFPPPSPPFPRFILLCRLSPRSQLSSHESSHAHTQTLLFL